jgi:hypothetical protein
LRRNLPFLPGPYRLPLKIGLTKLEMTHNF